MADCIRRDNVGIDSYIYREYDTSDESKELESQIVQMVYELSELPLEEIGVVE